MKPEVLLSIAVGLGLSAACGLRVFLPLFGLSVAALAGHLPLASGFSWLASPAAAVGLGTAMAAEIAGYYIPWVDHALDVIATPISLAGGILATAAVVTDLPPFVQWGIAVIGGGGAAGLFQGASVLLRTKSGALTGGLANPMVATAELIGATATATLALLAPLVCLLLVALTLIGIARRAGRLVFGHRATTRPKSDG